MQLEIIMFGVLVSITVLDISWNKNYQQINWISVYLSHNKEYVNFLFSFRVYKFKLEKRGI